MGKELTIAETILAQLGGNRFIAMTGSKTLCPMEILCGCGWPGTDQKQIS